MKRIVTLAYGLIAYLAFLATFLYLIGFVGGIVVPRSLALASASPTLPTVTWNLALVALFAVQHTVMARPSFKRWWTRTIPGSVERSTFVLVTCLILTLIFATWQPIRGTVWKIDYPIARAALHSLAALGWSIVLYSSFLINHFDLFGLRQVLLDFRKRRYEPLSFKEFSLYRYVRHPLMLGFLIAFWATPDMTLSHLIFAAAFTGYIMIGVRFEERTLMHELGAKYEKYRRFTPMLIPRLRLSTEAPIVVR